MKNSEVQMVRNARREYPSQWDAEATTGLLESLHVVNYHSLAGVVSDRLEKGGAARAAAD